MGNKIREFTDDGILVTLTMLDHSHVDLSIRMRITYELNGLKITKTAYPTGSEQFPGLGTPRDQINVAKALRRFDEAYMRCGGSPDGVS
ncbi:hypothetical protein SAMN04488128_103753 [Chitinophaga eiseniae]|uniref:Uncharacterized protein n=1 Tax=Chitinophaga eiseniae TaxID=634771 RepID=A0A1T4SXU9_9BACT|nr:hypothetical protein SAMN04488128_103753 [Chitinophaga eiseniae]